MQPFDHEKLDVYRVALEFVVLANAITEKLPKGRGDLIDQLQRAGASIALNVAEGAGEFSPKDKARFYRMARRSATECAAVLDLCGRLKLLEEGSHRAARELLLRIVSMLVCMVKGVEAAGTCTRTGSGSGSATGTGTGTGTHRADPHPGR